MPPSRCVYGYAVRSLDNQEIPVEVQERRMRKWTELNNHRFMEMYVDVENPECKLLEREFFSDLLDHLDRGDVLIMTDILGIKCHEYDISHLLAELDDIGAFLVFMKEGYDSFTEMGVASIQFSAIMRYNEERYAAIYEKTYGDDQP